MATNKPRNPSETNDEFSLQPENIQTEMDPHLQEVVLTQRARQDHNRAVVSENAEGQTMVDVIAKVKDPARDVPGLNVVRKIGRIVTGTVEVSAIEDVRKDPNVVSVKRATEVTPELQFSVPEIGADRGTLDTLTGPNGPRLTGTNVIVGVVDFGLDFRHRNLRRADGTSRVLFLWDQRGPQNAMSPAGFGFGREFTQARINQALNSSNPYQALGYSPGFEAHGTHVIDIAAGNGLATGNPGVAPEADLIFVHLHGGDFDEDESFGNSKTLLEAVDYIFGKAAQLGRPCVVNLSLGTHGGPHDGSTLAEQGFDELLTADGRAIVISAGNAFLRRSHASGVLNSAQARQVTWEISSADFTDNELEVWYAGDANFSVTLITPSGTRLGPVTPGNTASITRQGTRVGSIISRLQDPNNGSNQINILLKPSAGTGNWKVELMNTGSVAAGFDAWIERDDQGQSRFSVADDDRMRTLGSISCGRSTLVVGSYQATPDSRDLSTFSSSGPTRDGRQKPEVSAPGDMIRAAASMTQGGLTMSGTSMAAPHVTGLVALVMQAAGRTLNSDEVRNLVSGVARKNPPAGTAWHPRYGFGRIGAAASIGAVLPAGPPLAVPATMAAAAGAGQSTASTAVPLDGWFGQMVSAAERANARVTLHIEVEPVKRRD
jgi:subtilisin family serine protease